MRGASRQRVAEPTIVAAVDDVGHQKRRAGPVTKPETTEAFLAPTCRAGRMLAAEAAAVRPLNHTSTAPTGWSTSSAAFARTSDVSTA